MAFDSEADLQERPEKLPIPERQQIRDALLTDEKTILPIAQKIFFTPEQVSSIDRYAKILIEKLRSGRRFYFSLDQLLSTFSLSSPEGIALLNIAEAYLRITDQHTAVEFVCDQLSQGQWAQSVAHKKNPLLVNMIGHGLHGAMRAFAAVHTHRDAPNFWKKTAYQAATHVLLFALTQAIKHASCLFIMGETIESATKRAQRHRPYLYSYDLLGEAALTEHDALKNFLRYRYAIEYLGRHDQRNSQNIYEHDSVSVKLSALHPRYHEFQASRMFGTLCDRITDLALLAAHYNIAITIDAEETQHLELLLDVMEHLSRAQELSHWRGLGCAVQAYQKCAVEIVEYLQKMAQKTHRRFIIRLVKGAYWDSEIMRTQTLGIQDFPTYTRKVHTDVSYIACVQKMLQHPETIYPQFATHNAVTVSYVLEMARSAHCQELEFQALYGMGKELYQAVSRSSFCKRVRFYAPVGAYPELLPYLVRRMLENGANSSFIHQILAHNVSEDTLYHPLTETIRTEGQPHPHITPAGELFSPYRSRAKGYDLTARDTQNTLLPSVMECAHQKWTAQPSAVVPCDDSTEPNEVRNIHNPANVQSILGRITLSKPADITHMVQLAKKGQPHWAAVPAEKRADILDRIAQLLEENRHELLARCVYETGKTVPNALDDLREAVDFCYYYASCIRDPKSLLRQRTPHGVLAAIAPWNFPIAIFTGEVVACLAMGNAVVAKSSEAAQLVGAEIVRLMHQAGVPPTALFFATGPSKIGAEIVANPDIAGVVFTGSNATARAIYQALITRRVDAMLIAETGGINAMVVDSTALPERVTKSVLESAFDSAGQRCSALRILCLQEDIADTILTMLFGAMRELHISDPIHLFADMGPVITQDSKQHLNHYIQGMRAKSFRVHQFGQIDQTVQGHFVLPTIIEVNAVSDVTQEIFGPVLHIVRYQKEDIDRVLSEIRDLGFSLTFGIQSRIDSFTAELIKTMDIGNIYVNRNMIGAVVGTQPFGGQGLSGTGPKAGGPLYLHRFGVLSRDVCNPTSPAAPATRLPFSLWWPWLRDQAPLDAAVRTHLMHVYSQWTHLASHLSVHCPFGEKNTWTRSGRKDVLLLPHNHADFIEQLCACFAVECFPSVDLSCCENAQYVLDLLPPQLLAHITPHSLSEEFGLFLLHRRHPSSEQVIHTIKNMAGVLRGFVLSDDVALYDPVRLLQEKTVSVNLAVTGASSELTMVT